jgi:hypothetical protein
MREGRPVMKEHSADRMRWYIEPGLQVADAVAAHILERADVRACRDGLFLGCEQTFRLMK